MGRNVFGDGPVRITSRIGIFRGCADLTVLPIVTLLLSTSSMLWVDDNSHGMEAPTG